MDVQANPIQLMTNFLGGDFSGGRDTCQGDSGGPLMVKDHEKKKWVLAGVVSWGKGCGEAYSYGIYANVWNSFSWIKSVTGINYEI